MPTPWERDLVLARQRLTEWMQRMLPGASGVELSELIAPQSSGFSNETLLFSARWRDGGRERTEKLVVRIQPTGYQVFPEYDMRKQFECMRLLAATDVPVPRVFWLEERDTGLFGAPFYVMGQVEGQAASDNPPYTAAGWIHEAKPADQARIWQGGIDAIAKIVRLDWRELGFGFLDQPQYGRTGIDQQLGYYEKYLVWAAAGRRQPTIEAALEWLRANQPAGESLHLVWGDARIGNVLFRDFEVSAVLDWEMATLGGPEIDLGWTLFMRRFHTEGMGVPELPGFAGRDETLERFEQVSGHRPRHAHYYEVFGGFRFCVIMLRLAQQQVEYRGVDPVAGRAFELDNPGTRPLAGLLELPEPRTWVERGV
jgi:aminoglycoside phosphotransferase (APT) family kinase protein